MTPDARPLVLVVDDFEDNRMLYATCLSAQGFRVAEAVDGLDAVAKGTALVPDMIVMDLALPGIDGWEATRRLKENASTSHIPIIALTGHSLESHAARARAVRCDAFLVKPCLPETLLAKIRELLGGAK